MRTTSPAEIEGLHDWSVCVDDGFRSRDHFINSFVEATSY